MIFNNLFMLEISPFHHEKYSANLHKWLTRYAKDFPTAQVYRATSGGVKGDLAVGICVQDKLEGTLMHRILRNGATDTRPTELPYKWELVPNFWKDYRAIGRCAIDIKHTWSMQNATSRFKVSEDKSVRVCQWCFKSFEKKTIMVPREIWEFRKPDIVRLHLSVTDIGGALTGKIRALQVHPDNGMMIDHIWVKDEGEETFSFGEMPGYFTIADQEYVSTNNQLLPLRGAAYWADTMVEYEVAERIVRDCRARGWERSSLLIHGWENLDA